MKFYSLFFLSEYCASGDHTLLAAEKAIKEVRKKTISDYALTFLTVFLLLLQVVKEEADDYFVFLVSDANLGRYDITPEDLSKTKRREREREREEKRERERRRRMRKRKRKKRKKKKE